MKTQIEICQKYHSQYEPVQPNDMVAVALQTIGQIPICGTRVILTSNEKISWFFHCGEFSEDDNFYQPIHVAHLNDLLPEVVSYLALEQGFRFVIDGKEYEDVWKENNNVGK
jgi:hypothetical protein